MVVLCGLRSLASAAAAAVLIAQPRSTLAAYEKPELVLGEQQESCSTTCQREGRFCVNAELPVDASHLLEAAKKMGVTCNKVSRFSQERTYLPIFNSHTQDCEYAGDPTTTSCERDPPASTRRFCSCSTQNTQWLLGRAGQSCDETCIRAGGGRCAFFAHELPTKWEHQLNDPPTTRYMKDVTVPLGVYCQMHGQKMEAYWPGVDGTTCQGAQVASRVTRASCGAKDPNGVVRRLCPCLGSTSQGDSSHAASPFSAQALHGLGICHGGGWHEGKGLGTSQGRIAGDGPISSAEDCRQKVLTLCPQGNGATWDYQQSVCWCNVGMTHYDHDAGFKVCWFTDGRFTRGQLGGGYNLI